MLTALDLFAGAGGATQALTDAGFRVLAAIEKDLDAAATFGANHPCVRVLPQDVNHVSPATLRGELGLGRGDLTLLTACPPCQGFSTLGARDRNDARNDLVASVWGYAQEFLPAAVLIENVPGLRYDARWGALGRQLGEAGYRFRSWVADAVDFGVPQRRRRLLAIALRSDIPGEIHGDIRGALPSRFPLAAQDASEVIGRAGPIKGTRDEWHRARTPTAMTLERIRAIPPGGSHADLPEKLQLDCHKRLRHQGRTAATGPYGRIPQEGPAPTMTTRCTTVSCGRFIHPHEHRGISLREAALLQTFPPDYRFVGSHESVERQIGNAVPVKLAHALGLVVRGNLGCKEHTRGHE